MLAKVAAPALVSFSASVENVVPSTTVLAMNENQFPLKFVPSCQLYAALLGWFIHRAAVPIDELPLMVSEISPLVLATPVETARLPLTAPPK